MTVSKYGAEGQTIEGTFSGTYTRTDPNTKKTSTVTVKTGKFKVTRVADEQ